MTGPPIQRRSGADDLGRAGASGPAGTPAEAGRSRIQAFRVLVRSIADVDPHAVETAARRLGESRRWLAPLAWAAGTVVLFLDGVKLLVTNWRLSLIQLLPAAWIWLATWDLKSHLLERQGFRDVPVVVLIVLSIAILVCSIASYWCNTVFAMAIDGPPPPRLAPAIRRARAARPTILRWGLFVGSALIVATVIIPRTGRMWLFAAVLTAVIVVMAISFVGVPARILGFGKRKLPPKEAVGRAAAGSALSAVAMGPGFLLDRLGLLLLGTHQLRVLGFVLLAIGSALYAAGMSSVRVVTLSAQWTPSAGRSSAGDDASGRPAG